MSITIIEHSGKKIIYSDLRGYNHAQLMAHFKKEADLILEQPEPVLILRNVQDATVTKELLAEVKKQVKRARPNIFRGAVVGASGSKRILLMAVNKFTGIQVVPFRSQEEALKYLTRD